MKFSKEHLASLKKAICNITLTNGENILSNNNFINLENEYIENNLSHVRFIWDLFWASKWTKVDENRDLPYIDKHIQTALEAIYKDLKANVK